MVASPKSNERKNGHHHDHEPDEINDAIHDFLLMFFDVPIALAKLTGRQRASGSLMVKVWPLPPIFPVPTSTAAATKITSMAPTMTPRIPLPSDIGLHPCSATQLRGYRFNGVEVV